MYQSESEHARAQTHRGWTWAANLHVCVDRYFHRQQSLHNNVINVFPALSPIKTIAFKPRFQTAQRPFMTNIITVSVGVGYEIFAVFVQSVVCEVSEAVFGGLFGAFVLGCAESNQALCVCLCMCL